MQYPAINLNGTSAEALEDNYYHAMLAVCTAIDALRRAMPHGRDYQTLLPEAYAAAREEHFERIKVLKRMESDLLALTLHCAKRLDTGRAPCQVK